MEEQNEFFSDNHKRLLDIAAWAKYLAWIVLIVYVLLSLREILPYRTNPGFGNEFSLNIWGVFISTPFVGFNILIDMAATIVKGVVYYFVLKGISLGLSMIVETDINYREKGKLRNE